MNDFYNFLQTAKLNIHVAAYLDVGKDWDQIAFFKYVRIYYIRSGNAEMQLENKRLKLEEGYLYFIPSFSVLDGVCNDHMGHYFIHIIPDIYTEHFFKILPMQTRCKLDKDIADYLFVTICTQYQDSSIYSRLAVDSALKLLISNFFKDTTIDTQMNIERFSPVFEYIDKHIGEKIYIKNLSDLVYMDDSYFSNLFKKTFGISIQKYIMKKRTDKAKALLSSDKAISEIANLLNFYDTASFTNFFKKETGTSPTEFRKKFFDTSLMRTESSPDQK